MKVYVLYKGSSAVSFIADDNPVEVVESIASSTGCLVSTNTIDVDIENPVYPIDVEVVNGVASVRNIDQSQREAELLAIAKLDELRSVRNKKLAETDWTANSDVIMADEMRAYRQALRDITNTYSSLDTVVWPFKP